jgi:release factor glutamine methyltransferase
MLFRNKTVFFRDFKFIINENVYEPAEDSFLFAEKLDVKVGDRVLDMGTGCGLLGVLSAERAIEVVGVDINPHALHCAEKNAELNNVVNGVSFIQGDLFGPLKETKKFDLILFNAPYLPENENISLSWIERAWVGGSNGRSVIDAFLSKVANHLSKTGRLLLLQSTLSDVNRTLFRLAEDSLAAKIIAEVRIPFFETIVLIEATFNSIS